MAFSQNLLAGANTVPSCDVELCPRPPSRVCPILPAERQVTLNLIFLLEIQILASFSYQAFIFIHFPIILREKNFVS